MGVFNILVVFSDFTGFLLPYLISQRGVPVSHVSNSSRSQMVRKAIFKKECLLSLGLPLNLTTISQKSHIPKGFFHSLRFLISPLRIKKGRNH